MALKTSDALVVALCPTCHSQLDQGKDMTRDERRDMWDQAYINQMKTLIETGRLK
jgi:heterodisulfide reductase subunit B